MKTRKIEIIKKKIEEFSSKSELENETIIIKMKKMKPVKKIMNQKLSFLKIENINQLL